MLRCLRLPLMLAVVALAGRPAAGQTIFVSDPFTVAANTMVEAHTPNTAGGAWTRFLGTSGIIINAAADDDRNVAAGDWNIYGNATLPPGGATEVVVGIDVTFTTANANHWVD